jgi:hypothetical protein
VEKEFTKVKENFDKEHVEHGSLSSIVNLACDDLQVT